MEIFAIIATLFVIGSIFGWVLEVFFRRFFSRHIWMNPGFLTGPYLPVYGFGFVGMYALSSVFRGVSGNTNLPIWAENILTILIIGAILITIEFIAGLIFIKGLGLKLWDYSDRKGNTLGIICPLFDVLWTLGGAAYYFILHPILEEGISWISTQSNNIYYLFIGVVLGMMIADFAYSIHLATKISALKKEISSNPHIEKINDKIKSSQTEINNKVAKVKKKIVFKNELISEIHRIRENSHQDKND